MVDCGGPRCVQQRRLIKKELLTWMKKVPLIIGLQEVASHMLGAVLSRQLLQPLEDLDPPVEDWSPSETCPFCDLQTSPLTEKQSLPVSDTENNDASGVQLDAVGTRSPDGAAVDHDAPLDLSSSRHATDERTTGATSRAKVQLKVPLVHSKLGCSSGSRRYTPDELTAALMDICSGRLGTRRAATLYGIPRSTLRNNICRMGGGTRGGDAPARPPQAASWQWRLAQLRHKHDLGAGNARPFGRPPPRGGGAAGGAVAGIVERLTATRLAKEEDVRLEEQPGARWDGVRVAEQPPVVVVAAAVAERSLLRRVEVGPTEQPATVAAAALRIPRYRVSQPTSPRSSVTPGGSTEADARPASLKQLIAKTIAQKLRSRGAAVAERATAVGPRPAKRAKAAEEPVAPPDEQDEKQDDKRSRAKRGQYRKYNSALLLEAVRCVQRGEMSVHRAGSHYGVPHSTLEYKVKERHLLRKARTAAPPPPSDDAAAAAWPTVNGHSGRQSHSLCAPGFALNTSATDMLKKLQRKVQATAARGSDAGGDGQMTTANDTLSVK